MLHVLVLVAFQALADATPFIELGTGGCRAKGQNGPASMAWLQARDLEECQQFCLAVCFFATFLLRVCFVYNSLATP